MKYIVCHIAILFAMQCLSQDHCREDFSLSGSRAMEMRGTVLPTSLLPLKTSIIRKKDTISFTFSEGDKVLETMHFVIRTSVCDSVISDEKIVFYEGETLLPSYDAEGKAQKLVPTRSVIKLNAAKGYIIWGYKDRKEALYLQLDK